MEIKTQVQVTKANDSDLTSDNKLVPPLRIKFSLWCLAVLWTSFLAASLGWNYYHIDDDTLEMARLSAKIGYRKDLIYRLWNTQHGGVYVPVSKETGPNPDLSQIPERDIKTPSGRPLTLVNPAYMTRQVHHLEKERFKIQGHITSLKPIRPQNTPDPWEVTALQAFEKVIKEVDSVEKMGGESYFRYMAPFITENMCLKCHAQQGYKLGDIRGGISISIPLAPFREVEWKHLMNIALGHLLIWLVGLLGLGWGGSKLIGNQKERLRLEVELQHLSFKDELTGLYNRRGFFTLAEQEMKVAHRSKRPLLLIFADLDGLKGINDSLGHQTGDQAIKDTAQILQNTFRQSDIIARIGGDEFSALARETLDNTGQILKTRLMDNLKLFNDDKKRAYQISLSFGLVQYDPDLPVSLDKLLSQADTLMYEQKKTRPVRSDHLGKGVI